MSGFVSSSSFLGGDHLQDEADNGVGGLVGVHLCKEMADVVCGASLLTGHEPKQPGKTELHIYSPGLKHLSASIQSCSYWTESYELSIQ